jgi:rare lipoprotein A
MAKGGPVLRHREFPLSSPLLIALQSFRAAAYAGTAIGLVAALAACSSRDTSRPSEARFNRPAERQAESKVDAKYGTSPSPRFIAEGQSVPKGGGGYKLGSPYKIAGRWYTPAEDPNYDRTGLASWYGTDFHGRKTANGEIFDMGALTAAHPTLPLPSYAYVTNLDNGRTILVRINDRGPYAHDRVMDLSRRSAQMLGTETRGIGNVRVRYAGRAPLNGDDSHERQFLASQPWSQRLAQMPVSRSVNFGPRMGLGASTDEDAPAMPGEQR